MIAKESKVNLMISIYMGLREGKNTYIIHTIFSIEDPSSLQWLPTQLL